MKTLEQIKTELLNYRGRPVKIMEVCGTHTAAIFKSGLRSLLPPTIQLLSGPGCPVCVTVPAYIDRLLELAREEQTCILTFGDMMKVKGSIMSLAQAKAEGARVRVLYSPLAALDLALAEPSVKFIFAAVGFETTTPVYALLLEEMERQRITNLQLLTSLKTILPVLPYLCETEEKIDAFLCPGHVSVITGSEVYAGLAEKYRKPFVIGGFSGEHLLTAVYEIMRQLQTERFTLKNLYTASVSARGNEAAKKLVEHFFQPVDEYWRGIGRLPHSGLRLSKAYQKYDAGSVLADKEEPLPPGCRCREIILGRLEPRECPLFGLRCTPSNAVGPCMVSEEGSCGIWYKNRRVSG